MGTKASTIIKPFAVIATVILAGAMAVAIGLSLGAGQAWAGSGWPISKFEKQKTVYISYLGTVPSSRGGKLGVEELFCSQRGPNVTKAKSSNTKVAAVEAVNLYFKGVLIKVKKPGKAKITYNRGGKKTINLVVVKYVNPVKSFTVGKTQLASRFDIKAMEEVGNGTRTASAPVDKFTGKLKITPKAGWKVVSIYYYGSKGQKTIKNNTKVSNLTSIVFEMKNTKTGMIEHLSIYANGASYQAAN